MILEIIKQRPATAAQLMALKRKLAKRSGGKMPRHSELWREYLALVKAGKIKFDEKFARLLKRRAVRTLSGVAPVAVLTKPW